MKPKHCAAVVLCVCVLCACMQSDHPPLPEALDALQTDNAVTYEKITVSAWEGDPCYIFKPAADNATTGLIFYGGSQVDPRSYAPPARDIAAQGFLVALVTTPRDMALLAPGRAGDVIDYFPEIDTWAVGGHSMGGIAACEYAHDNAASINSVVLWASRPTEENRLDETSLDVLSIYATNDGIYNAEVIEESRAHLPEDTVWVEIEGGNHYQFGWYQDDHAPVDGEAQISRQEQMQQIVSATVAFLSDRGYPYRK